MAFYLIRTFSDGERTERANVNVRMYTKCGSSRGSHEQFDNMKCGTFYVNASV